MRTNTALATPRAPEPAATTLGPDLTALLALVGDPATLRRWCERAELHDVNALMDAELMSAPLHKLNRWAALQANLRAMRRQSPGRSDAALDALVRAQLGLAADAPIGPALREALRAPAPEPGTLSPREALLLLGGVAGARAIAERMAEAADAPPKIRQVRDRLRHAGDTVRKLGAGYYAAAARRADPVGDWAEDRVSQIGREPLPSFLKATLDAYPHGDAHAIAAWLHQCPGHLIVRRGMVCYVDGALA